MLRMRGSGRRQCDLSRYDTSVITVEREKQKKKNKRERRRPAAQWPTREHATPEQPMNGRIGYATSTHVAWCAAHTHLNSQKEQPPVLEYYDFHTRGRLECQHRQEPPTTQMKRLVTVPKELPIPKSTVRAQFALAQCCTIPQASSQRKSNKSSILRLWLGEAAARLAAAAKSPVTGMWLSARTLAGHFCSTVVMVVQTRYRRGA